MLRPAFQLCMNSIPFTSSARILFPTSSILSFLLGNFIQHKIWMIWNRHHISQFKTMTTKTTNLHRVCFFGLLLRFCCVEKCLERMMNMYTILSSLFIFWNLHQWGDHLLPLSKLYYLRLPMVSQLANKQKSSFQFSVLILLNLWAAIGRVYH